MLTRGIVQIYTGDSKGKTTAALGQVVRCVGHGFCAAIVQYMKGSTYYGELRTLNLLPGVEVYQYGRVCKYNTLIRQGESDCLACGQCFVSKGKATDFDRLYSQKALARSRQLIAGGQHDLVVLDEILNAVFFQLVTEAEVLSLLDQRPAHVELVLTGRNATPALLDRADLVTEMKKIKHPFDAGLKARRGIEY